MLNIPASKNIDRSCYIVYQYIYILFKKKLISKNVINLYYYLPPFKESSITFHIFHLEECPFLYTY